ncbi:MAG: NADH-quinone oxidoreductase subunit N [Candidatus Promineifilaceae bacterium]|jgi:NADH-quinone oxidoreductase subunit N
MEFTAPDVNIFYVLPAVIVAAWAVLVMILDMIYPREKQGFMPMFTAVGLVLALGTTLLTWGLEGGTFTSHGVSMIIADSYVHYLNIIFLGTGLMTVLIASAYLKKEKIVEDTEFYMLLLFSMSGMMLMGAANDLILIFIALELLSIPLYVMCGIARPRQESEESALKYFLLGAFASGFLVFGIALLYGSTGSTSLPAVAENFDGVLSMAGLAMFFVGLAFKVGVVPFHMWTPDVYEGAPTVVTSFMSVGAKVGGFAAMIRFFSYAVPESAASTWVLPIAIIAALTMVLGNVVAVSQTNMKRLLAYSSIAHGGYIMMAVAAIPYSEEAVSGALTYMMAYMFTNLGAFAVVMLVEKNMDEGGTIHDYKGLSKQNFGVALALAYFMFSLIGMPLTGGFIGKFVVFKAVIEADLIWLAFVGVFASAISAYYYLRIVFFMFMQDGEATAASIRPINAAVAIALVATLLIGFIPGPWIDLAQNAVMLASQTLLAGG